MGYLLDNTLRGYRGAYSSRSAAPSATGRPKNVVLDAFDNETMTFRAQWENDFPENYAETRVYAIYAGQEFLYDGGSSEEFTSIEFDPTPLFEFMPLNVQDVQIRVTYLDMGMVPIASVLSNAQKSPPKPPAFTVTQDEYSDGTFKYSISVSNPSGWMIRGFIELDYDIQQWNTGEAYTDSTLTTVVFSNSDAPQYARISIFQQDTSTENWSTGSYFQAAAEMPPNTPDAPWIIETSSSGFTAQGYLPDGATALILLVNTVDDIEGADEYEMSLAGDENLYEVTVDDRGSNETGYCWLKAVGAGGSSIGSYVEYVTDGESVAEPPTFSTSIFQDEDETWIVRITVDNMNGSVTATGSIYEDDANFPGALFNQGPIPAEGEFVDINVGEGGVFWVGVQGFDSESNPTEETFEQIFPGQ